MQATTSTVGVVVIGRNEGERLKRCLTSLVETSATPIVYVDSGSSDDSVNLAQGLGAVVVELDSSKPFNMARARNSGFEILEGLGSNIDFIQFVDGDCEVNPDWIEVAKKFLERKPSVVGVCGHLLERDTTTSIYNHLAAMEWQGPIGEIDACGGIAMYRAKQFADSGGFNETMIAGEEGELCQRLRDAGGEIWRIDTDMATHDAALTRFSQWWNRSKRGGYALADAWRMSTGSDRQSKLRRLMSSLLYGIATPVAWCIAVVLGLTTNTTLLIVSGSVIAVAILLKPSLGAYRYRKHLNNTDADAWIYAVFCTLGKIPESLGILKFAFDSFMGKQGKLIEY